MIREMPTFPDFIKSHWFLPLFAGVLLIEYLVSPLLLRENAQWAEKIILFDLCLFVPLAYFLCYRARHNIKALAIRTIGLIFVGVWFASWLIPENNQNLLPFLGVGRNIGLAIFALIELIAFAAIVKLVYSRNADSKLIANQTGMPELFVRLAMLEARFWKAVWNFFRPRK